METAIISEKGSIWKGEKLRNSLLTFDKIYVPDIYKDDSFLKADLLNSNVSIDEVHYLIEKGIILYSPVEQNLLVNRAYEKFLSSREKEKFTTLPAEEKQLRFTLFLEREAAQQVQSQKNEIIVPLSSNQNFLEAGKILDNSSEVLELVIEGFPTIGQGVPFDEIIDFKKSNQSLYNEMIKWVKKASEDKVSNKELQDEIESIIHTYKNENTIAELKYSKGRFEMLMSGLDTLKKVIILDFGGLEKKSASLRVNQAGLLEAEQNNSGTALSYYVKSENEYG